MHWRGCEGSHYGLTEGIILLFTWNEWGDTKNFTQDTKCPGKDFNRTLQPRYLVSS